jgi:hypothetical protein
MEITLNLPDLMIRKIRALSILEGGKSADIESQLVSLLDTVLSTSIAKSIGYSAADAPARGESNAPSIHAFAKTFSDNYVPPEDHSGVSDGLGDEDLPESNDGMETNPEALLAPAGAKGKRSGRGLQDDEIEHDTVVDDPEHEAATVAPSVPAAPAGEAERMFADMADMPPPALTLAEERAIRRRKPLKSKAKVREAMWGEA